MNINTVDLNLFLVFQSIYQTGSVTLAGDRLSMTQSAVSNALKRMRERFSDPLFVRTPKGMMPTPLADMLIGPVEAGLQQFTQAIDHASGFDPLRSDRVFRIAINDIGQLVMMPSLLAAARERAAGIRFQTVDAAPGDAVQRMQLGEVDLAIGSWAQMGQAIYQQRLFDETFVVLMHRRNPLARPGLTIEAYMAANHIAYCPSGSTDDALQETLKRTGVMSQRRIVLTAGHSLGLSTMVASSQLLLTAPQRLARAMAASRPDLCIRPAPFEVVPFQIRQQWHERFHRDAGNRWLRQLVFELFHEPSATTLAIAGDVSTDVGEAAEAALAMTRALLQGIA